MNIQAVKTEEGLKQCFPLMSQLRPYLTRDDFISQVFEQFNSGYELAALFSGNEKEVVALAGYRLSQNLAWGKFLYVDDLVTDDQHRSQGYGHTLLDWLLNTARENNCDQFHLDSGVQRIDAHRFYKREGLELASYHFSTLLK